MLEVDREQVLAYRVAGHHLDRRVGALAAISACGLQDYPPGFAAVALHARSEDPLPRQRMVTVNAMRGAPYVVPREDVAVFTAALVPGDEGLKSLVGALPAREVVAAGLTVREALDRVADAAREGLAGGPLERDDFHQAMRERLPGELLPWCRGCQSHHVRPGLWRALGPLGITEMPTRATFALAEPSGMAVAEARKELVRRFLRCYGPATHTQLAGWAQTAAAHAKALFAGIRDELEAVRAGGRRAWVLTEDRARLEQPPAAAGVRMLGGYDPYVAQPEREALAPDPELRRRMSPPVLRPGVVLHDGGLAALWRGRKRGGTLDVEVEWLGPEVDLAAEAASVAVLRGCEVARVRAV